MTHVVLSLGSNINREKNIRFALEKIVARFGETENSPIYETSSMGFDGPAFFNFVLGFHTSDSIFTIREYLRGIEAASGRIRGNKAFENRILDIDMVLFGNKNLQPQGFNIPRDEIEKYAYVLKPLSDLYPLLTHPIGEKTFAQMWQDFDSSQQLWVANFSL